VAFKFLPSFSNQQVVEAFVVCIFIKGGISILYVLIYVYGSELFASNVRGVANGLAFFGAKMVTLLSPLMLNLSRDVLHLNPMVGFGSMSVLAMLALLILPETFNIKVE